MSMAREHNYDLEDGWCYTHHTWCSMSVDTPTPTIPWYDRLEPFSTVERAQRLTALYEPGVKEGE
jgi:hypothetical protein